MSDIVSETRDAILRAIMRAVPMAEEVKEKVGTAVEDVKEKAAPVVEKVKSGVGSAVDAVKDGAEKVGDLLTPDAPGLNVKNELFDELEDEVRQQKEESMSAAEDMQRKILELMKKYS